MADADDKPQSRHDLDAVHERAMRRFDAIWSAQQEERALCLEDRRFYSIQGAQWDDAWGAQFENAPRMEVNKVHAAVVRIFSEYRDNRISVDFRPKGDDNDETADTLDGLYRADEEESGAQEAYDMAFEEGVGGGFGAWRLRACYEDESDPENEQQRIRFELIPDADQSVFFDLDAKRQDKSDGKHGFILWGMTPEAFGDEYPGKTPADIAAMPVTSFEWFKPDFVHGAEYYEIEETKAVKVTLTRLQEEPKEFVDPDPDILSDLKAQGWKVAKRRKYKRARVHKYIISGAEVLEDEGLIAGSHIPIVPFYGKRWYVEGIERCAGHTRYAKDPQRIYNGQVSALAEVAGASPHERPIFDPEQVAGFEQEWADSNINRTPYQRARALRNEDGSIAVAGPLGKVEPPSVPQALAALIQISGNDIAELIGSNENLDEVPANTSAQAIELVHTRADSKTFIYLDNFRKAMKRCGEIWLSMASELYVEPGRKMQAVDQNGGRKFVTLADKAITPSGDQVTVNDLVGGKFDVTVDVGPSSNTRRDATVRSLVGMASAAQNDAELQNALISSALMNMDGEGIDDIQKWIRMRLVKAGIVQPTDEEKATLQQEQQGQAPDPVAALTAAKTEEAHSNALLKTAQADKVTTDKEKSHAETLLTLAQAETLGGPSEAPPVPDGLETAERVAHIDKTNAEADRIRTEAAHLPAEIGIAAHKAETDRIKAEQPKIRRGSEIN